MIAGLERTIEVLTSTGNEAAVDVLLRALDSAHAAIQEQAILALLDRRSALGQCEIVRRWNSFDDRLKTIVAERSGRIHDALRDALLGDNSALCTNACDALLWAKEYDLVPALITASEDRSQRSSDETAHTLLALAELLYEECAAPRDYRNRRDPQLVRQHLLGSLETSLGRYDKHHREEVLVAFLLLTNRENAPLKRILLNPQDRSFPPLMGILSSSSRVGIMRLLLAYLDDPHAPHSALQALSHRSDEAFLRLLLRKLAADMNPQIRTNLKRMEAIAWLREDLRRLKELSEVEQQSAVQLAIASGMKRPQVFEVVQFVLRHGKPGGRRAASQALGEFKGTEANQLALAALDDSDPQVQVNILPQLRERGIPGAMTRLLELLDSPHAAVRQSVKQCLAEFTFKRFLAAFDLLATDARLSTAALVHKVDPETITQLSEELAAPVRIRKVRALEIVACMQVAKEVEMQLIDLLADEDHVVRLEAAQLLAGCDTPQTKQALRVAMLDRQTIVQDAAERSLRRLTQTIPPKAGPPPEPAEST